MRMPSRIYIQNECLSAKSCQTIEQRHNQPDPSCFSLLSPLFIPAGRLTHVEIPAQGREKMASIPSTREKPQLELEEKESFVEQKRQPDNHSTSGFKSDGSISEGSNSPQKLAPVAYTAPNGGYLAWSAVAGGFLCQFASFGFLNVWVTFLSLRQNLNLQNSVTQVQFLTRAIYSLGIFQTHYQEDNLSNYNASTISWIFTFQLFLMFLCAQADGMFVDMFGPRAVMIPSAILELLGIAMLSFCQKNQYYQFFLAQGVCFGVGSAGLFMPGKSPPLFNVLNLNR